MADVVRIGSGVPRVPLRRAGRPRKPERQGAGTDPPYQRQQTSFTCGLAAQAQDECHGPCQLLISCIEQDCSL